MPQAPASDRSREFLAFVQRQAKLMREKDSPPKSIDEWNQRRRTLRRNLIRSMGGFPKQPCPLEPQVVGGFERDGYRVEKLLLQTRPGVWMTANAYVPAGPERRPAVLCVHGHWRLAKQEPVVQSRCIGLAKLGFFVLMVDAFGAGERGVGKALGEYHGEMVAATLWPTGRSLSGLQVYDNMRAIDYLQSRPEVDGENIGVTGASGGGNQTMYVGALDERLKCVVPVCSVGTYQAYLGAACCMCEVVPAALSYTEESGVLALVAPRALMLVNATRDAFQFSVGEAKKSLAAAKKVFRLYDKQENARHAIFESGHDYSKPMREAMYGWMAKHLKTQGDGSPIDEPEIKTEEAEALRCFPGQSRPASFLTLPGFAARETRQLLKKRAKPNHLEQWRADETLMRESLARVLGGKGEATQLKARFTTDEGVEAISYTSEPGITIECRRRPASGNARGSLLLLDLQRGKDASKTKLAELLREHWDVVTLDLRATGAAAVARDKIGAAPDHNSAEWSMWIGRPLLGQWVWDVQRILDVLEEKGQLEGRTTVVGTGAATLTALCATALDRRIKQVALVNGLASFLNNMAYKNQRLANMAPGILRDVGDVPHIAALTAPRRLVVAGSTNGVGEPLSRQDQKQAHAYTIATFKLEKAADKLRFVENTPMAVAAAVK